MEKLKQSRAGARGWLTRESDMLADIVKLKGVTLEEIKLRVEEFDKRLKTLDDVQEKIQELITDENDMDEEITRASTVRNRALVSKLEAVRVMGQLKTASTGSSVSSGKGLSSTRLPKLELPKFNGDITYWQTFWDKFVAIVDQSDIPVINKFTYLQSLLEGEALLSIQGLTLTESHYHLACKILKERYGRTERIRFAHIQALLNMSTPLSSECTMAELWKLRDDLNVHIRSLESLGADDKTYGLFLTPLILSRLPEDIRLEWSRTGEGKESDLGSLMTFLQTEIQRRERSDTFRDTMVSKRESSANGLENKFPSAMALQATSDSTYSKLVCNICNRKHTTSRCRDLTKLSINERKAKLRSHNLCYCCLGKGHIARGCVARCEKCGKRHHSLICTASERSQPVRQEASSSTAKVTSGSRGDKDERSADVSTGDTSHVGVAWTGEHLTTVLQTAKVKVVSGHGIVEATLLFDSGSDRSYVTSDLVHRVRPEWVGAQPIAYTVFGGNKTSGCKLRDVYKLGLQSTINGINGYSATESLTAVEVPVICRPISRTEVPCNFLRAFGDLGFADDYGTSRNITVDVLIGQDFYWNFMERGLIRLDGGPVAQETKFGWVVSGSWKGNTAGTHNANCAHQLVCLNDVPELDFQRIWDIEQIGVGPIETENKIIDPVLQKFQNSVKYIDNEGRYEVSLPWKNEYVASRLLNNEKLAKRRLGGLTKKLARSPDLHEAYDKALSEMEQDGVIEEVPTNELCTSNPVFYLPHRPVVKYSSLTTKVRPVFDASAKGFNGLSLNDCLEVGPCLLGNLVEILIRFRRWPIAITADITKAFLQIKVRKEDRDVHRFLWNHGGEIRVMRFVRVPFGNKSSPFLLNATIKYHLSNFPPSPTKVELEENLYCDDLLTGADTAKEGYALFKDGDQIMLSAGMTFAKLTSNDVEMSEMFFEDFKTKYLDVQTLKILGLKWLANLDCFSYDGVEVPADVIVTKRIVLSYIARMFDPLGFLNPFLMTIKIMFQDLWTLGISWDDEIPYAYSKRFWGWAGGLKLIQNWYVPRCYVNSEWKKLHSVEVCGFGDASERGYGACVYLRVPNSSGTYDTRFVISRARVAPLKKQTLPRLELLGALLCARLVVFVIKALRLPPDTNYKCWTDSTVVLSWIHTEPCQLKTFVANRICQIQELTTSSCWFHCAGVENPADLVTRGVFADKLISSKLWLHGPRWLAENVSVSGISSFWVPEEGDAERKVVSLSVQSETHSVFNFERWSSFSKALNVIGYACRFYQNLGKQIPDRVLGLHLTYDERMNAKVVMFRYIQKQYYSMELSALRKKGSVPKTSSIASLDPFLADDELLRIKGRLQLSELSYEEKHPVILPKCHLSFLLVRHQHKLLNHAGVDTLVSTLRSSFWIVGLRRLAKKVKRECVACKRLDSKHCSQPVSPLPEMRVTKAPVFSVTGLDYCGPLYCVDLPTKKHYILLFTCAVVRAIHLELTDSLALPDCMLAIRRFAARRGLPKIFHSDNAKTFVGAEVQLRKYFGHCSPQWRYLVPRAPWWGGYYERLVGSVKSALKKTIGSRCLTRIELQTTLCEVECCINSRPLTFVGDSVDCRTPLSPNHFLIGRVAGFVPSSMDVENVEVNKRDLNERETVREARLDGFWSVWSQDYLRNLAPALKEFVPRCSLKLGSVVLIKEDNLTRMKWLMGVVVELFPGKDGVVRSVKLKTSRGMITRAVQKLHDLEISDAVDDVVKNVGNMQSDKATGVVTRSGRIVKPIVRMDL